MSQKGSTQPKEENGLRTLLRGLSVISLFDVHNEAWGFMDITRALGLSKPTVNRLLKTLVSAGFMVLDKSDGKYHLGPSMLRAVYLTLSPRELARAAHPHLESLAAATGETAAMTVWTESGPLLIDIVFTWHPFKLPAVVGTIFDDYSSSHSKLFLAFGPESRRRALLDGPLTPRTDYTISAPDKLAAELERVKREEIAYDLQERDLGVCAVAAPVRDGAGIFFASVAVIAPADRFGPGDMKRLSSFAASAAKSLSRDFGYRKD